MPPWRGSAARCSGARWPTWRAEIAAAEHAQREAKRQATQELVRGRREHTKD